MLKSKHIMITRSYQRVYHALSNALKGEVAIKVNSVWFNQIHILNRASERLCVQVAMSLQGGVFAPSEYMPAKNIYMLHSGVAFINGSVLGRGKVRHLPRSHPFHALPCPSHAFLINGSVLGRGKVWGLGSLRYSLPLKRSSAISFTYCEVLYMEGLWLRELADACDPVTSKRIKIWAAFSALKQKLLENLVEWRAEERAKTSGEFKPKLLGAIGRQKTTADHVISSFDKIGTQAPGEVNDTDAPMGLPQDEFNMPREMNQMKTAIARLTEMQAKMIDHMGLAGPVSNALPRPGDEGAAPEEVEVVEVVDSGDDSGDSEEVASTNMGAGADWWRSGTDLLAAVSQEGSTSEAEPHGAFPSSCSPTGSISSATKDPTLFL